MAYEAEAITYSQKIFYYLLCHGALSDMDTGAKELYRAYVEHEDVMNLVKNQAEIADCRIERYGTCIYLMPDIDNKYLGFTKADLKKELCKSGATDRDYYLAQFVILTLMVEFYDGQGSTSKSREFLKLGELQNIISDAAMMRFMLPKKLPDGGKRLLSDWMNHRLLFIITTSRPIRSSTRDLRMLLLEERKKLPDVIIS